MNSVQKGEEQYLPCSIEGLAPMYEVQWCSDSMVSLYYVHSQSVFESAIDLRGPFCDISFVLDYSDCSFLSLLGRILSYLRRYMYLYTYNLEYLQPRTLLP